LGSVFPHSNGLSLGDYGEFAGTSQHTKVSNLEKALPTFPAAAIVRPVPTSSSLKAESADVMVGRNREEAAQKTPPLLWRWHALAETCLVTRNLWRKDWLQDRGHIDHEQSSESDQ
jgi:hypothetical protein